MTILENIIRKALFERKQRLNEVKESWTYIGGLRKPILNKVESLVPTFVKGFELDLSGDSEKNISNSSIAKWLSNITNTTPRSAEKAVVDPIGSNSKAPSLNQFTSGNYVFIYGKDNQKTRVERKGVSTKWHDIINVIVLPLDNLEDILTNVNIDKIGINAWKYPSAKGTNFEKPRTPGQSGLLSGNTELVGQSPLLYISELKGQQDLYKELLPIAREMKNTPQPNGDMNRIDDINDAIEQMESFIQDYPDFDLLSKAMSPKGQIKGIVQVTGAGLAVSNLPVYEKWDGTDSKQAAALDAQSYADQAAQNDAAAVAAGTTIVDVQDQEYETADSPAGKIMFTGKWNLETQQPIDGVATDEAGNKWEGIWNEKGQFITGTGYKKIGDGEWSGQMIKGFAKGYGEYKSPNISFTGYVTNQNGAVVPVKGNENIKWQSETVPSKFESFKGELVNGKWYEGKWIRYASESGKIVEYVYTGTFNPTTPETPKDGSVTRDSKIFGTYTAGVFAKK
jgi:hypothetical protein